MSHVAHPTGHVKHPGKYYRFEYYDLKNWDSDSGEEPRQVVLEGHISWREHLLDTWAKVERTVLAAATILLSPTEELRERTWKLLYRQSVNTLIQLVNDLFLANDIDVPADFVTTMTRLYQLRNVLAHNESRPGLAGDQVGLMLLKPLQFKKGQYVTLTYSELETTTERAEQIMEKLVPQIPDADGSNVELSDEEVERLREGLDED
jgi:hypothetical protein